MKKLFLKMMPIVLILSIIVTSCTMPTATPTPNAEQTSTIPTQTPAANPISADNATSTATMPQSDDVWERITTNQKIIIGTSWDYPPFASIDPNFHAVGFDIALIEEIGRRLNIPVEIQNFTFEGLPDALHLNQIDLAIAAISITPDRASRASFSPIYYVNQTAILAKTGSPVINITDFKQLTAYRVGVQRGTTYESMVQTLLIDTGLISDAKVLRYMQADEAIRDLLANRVDVVVLGQATASYYGAEPQLRVVGKGFDDQNLAIAMRLETPRLKAEIDRVMDDMLTDGTILSMIQQYIQSDAAALPTAMPTLQITATPLPPIRTATAPVCVNGMKFVADVTFGDNNMQNPPFVKAKTTFVKTWRVENTGTCTWTPNYRLTYAYGNVPTAQMNGQPLNIPGDIAPGQQVDLSVSLIAPNDPITYQGFWQIETDKGYRFGQTIWVAVTTLEDPENPAATEQPTGKYCVVVKTSPTTAIKVNENFDTVWMVKNISGKDWAVGSVDYKYSSGTKMHEKDRYDLTAPIKNSEGGKVIVDMIAPDKPGLYSTNWLMVSGNRTLCVLYVTINVIAK